MESYRASSLPRSTRLAAWCALYRARVEEADWVVADHDGFDAELRIGELGPARLARLTCGRSTIERTAEHTASASRRIFSLILQANGSGVFSQYGHRAALRHGDFILCDNAAPHSYQTTDSAELVVLRVPATVLKERLPSPENFCGRQLPATEGLTCTLAAVTRSVCAQLEKGLSRDFRTRVATHLLDMIATSYAIAFDSQITASAGVSARLAQVKRYIEQHLRDPELSPCSIASELRMSPRYLRMIFSTNQEPVSAYILRRRLEECARQMADPLWRGHSITEIAFAWGFNSVPHFTRSFRDRYGTSPGHYRRLRLEGKTQETAPAAAASGAISGLAMTA